MHLAQALLKSGIPLGQAGNRIGLSQPHHEQTVGYQTSRASFQHSQTFLQRFFEATANGHDFSDALHLRA